MRSIDDERQVLYLRVLFISLASPLLALMAARAYQPTTFLWEFLRVGGELIAPTNAVPIEFISSLLLGLYVGLLVLFTIDTKKRVQGYILTIGSVIALFVLGISNILLPNISVTDPFNWIGLLAGILLGLLIELSKFKNILYNRREFSKNDLTFPVAAVGLFAFISAIILSTLLQAIVAGTSKLVLDVVVTISTIYLLAGFIRYSSQSNVAVLGPRNSGKSLLLLGLYLSYRERGIAGQPEGYMQDLISEADSIAPGEDFPISNTTDLEKLWFVASTGNLFPQRIKISVTDHTGEILSVLGENLSMKFTLQDKFSVVRTKYRKYNPLTTFIPGGERNFLLFENEVRTADAVLLLLDVERLQNNDIGHINDLQTIGQRAKTNGASVCVVATKCDLLIDEFSDATDNPLDHGLETEFRTEIEKTLIQGYSSVEQLCDSVDVDQIFPVYYETKREDGTYYPKLDEHNSLQYQGMDSVGDQLIQYLK